MKLLYVRHGKTVGNLEGSYIGRTESPLLDIGRLEAADAGKGLIDSGEKIDVIITSPLSRAYDTACIIASEIGYPKDSIKVTKLLLERAGGSFESSPQSGFFALSEEEQVAGGAESFGALARRAAELINRVRKEYSDKTVLLVGSAMIGEMIRSMIKYGDPAKMFDDGPLPNTEVIRLI